MKHENTSPFEANGRFVQNVGNRDTFPPELRAGEFPEHHACMIGFLELVRLSSRDYTQAQEAGKLSFLVHGL